LGGCSAADKDRLVPIKDFGIYKDSVFIQEPNGNGKIWDEGNFCLRFDKNNDRKITYAFGVHKTHFKNGNHKGIVDYNKKNKEFDTIGTKLYIAKFSD